MDRSDASALADLQMHWDEAYEIGLDGNVWWARFHGAPDDLRAHTGAELRELIRADYAYRQQATLLRPPSGTNGANAEDEDDYADAYETETAADEPASGLRPLTMPGQSDFAGLRGERMSI